jgi:outer membrane protein, multidrug efflux system
LDLLDAQRAQLKDEDAYAESHSNSALSAVLLYKSLAGDGLNILLNRRKA